MRFENNDVIVSKISVKKVGVFVGLSALTITVLMVIGWLFLWPRQKNSFLSPEAKWIFKEKPLQKYSFPELRQKAFQPDGIWIEGSTFYFWTEGRKVSGQIRVPTGTVPEGGWPVVIMIRGYVDREIYQTGIGTQRAAEYFAKNGFLTLAPDFLGYGESDMPPNNSLEERFLCPVEVLQLITSVKNIKEANPGKINLWGHSNGGQIALSVLEISGKNYPTVLWAPVSKPFPYSILYYTDEYDDYGKALRKLIAGFDAQYEANEFSIHKFYDWISAPIQIHQGTADESVPLKWSEDLEANLKKLNKEVELYVYSGADHNLQPGWNEAIKRSLEWFKR